MSHVFHVWCILHLAEIDSIFGPFLAHQTLSAIRLDCYSGERRKRNSFVKWHWCFIKTHHHWITTFENVPKSLIYYIKNNFQTLWPYSKMSLVLSPSLHWLTRKVLFSKQFAFKFSRSLCLARNELAEIHAHKASTLKFWDKPCTYLQGAQISLEEQILQFSIKSTLAWTPCLYYFVV